MWMLEQSRSIQGRQVHMNKLGGRLVVPAGDLCDAIIRQIIEAQ